jgi:hypothetical protein
MKTSTKSDRFLRPYDVHKSAIRNQRKRRFSSEITKVCRKQSLAEIKEALWRGFWDETGIEFRGLVKSKCRTTGFSA